jgi:hypothetical protein
MRKQALQAIVWVETGLGWRSSLGRRNGIAFPKRSRSRYPHTIRFIRAFVDSTNSFGQSITTASRNAVNHKLGSVNGVAVCAGLAALRVARLAAVLEEARDRADSDVEDRVGDLPGADVRVCDGAVAVAHAAKVRAGRITAKAVRVG